MQKSYIFLTIQTATKQPFIFLSQGSEVIEVHLIENHHHLTENLIPYIEKALNNHSLNFKDLAAVACCNGPGSFTGIRIGISTAQTLSYALKIPLINFHSLELFVPNNPTAFSVALDAKSGGIYTASFSYKNETIECIKGPKKLSVESWSTDKTVLSPDAVQLIERKPELKPLIIPAKADFVHISKIIYNRFAKKNFTNTLNPLYLSSPA